MSKFNTLSFNQLRSNAAKAGFKGTNPKRQDLEAFLESTETATVTTTSTATVVKEPKVKAIKVVKEPKVKVVKAPKIKAVTPEGEAKVTRKYNSIPRTEVAARRNVIGTSLTNVLGSIEGGLSAHKLYAAVLADAGLTHNANLWNDMNFILRERQASKAVQVTVAEGKKRPTYGRPAVVADSTEA